MERKPEVWPRKHRVYFYRDPVIQLRITMREINLREFYPEIYKKDYVVSLPDEVVEALMEFRRGDTAYRIRTYRYKAYFKHIFLWIVATTLKGRCVTMLHLFRRS